jgi:hypothetical protein
MKIENLGNRSRVGGARLNVCSEARRRISWLGFMSKGVLEVNPDFGNIQRSILGKGSVSSGE